MDTVIAELRERVSAIGVIVDAAVELIKGIRARLQEALAQNNMTLVAELSAELASHENELAAAVAENTDSVEPAPVQDLDEYEFDPEDYPTDPT